MREMKKKEQDISRKIMGIGVERSGADEEETEDACQNK